ncbi:acyl-CoA-binding domain-containing protein 5A [Aplochiton taeniatus]
MMDCVIVENDRNLTELRFDAAVKVIKSLPPNGSFQPSNDMMLRFYSFYKQATIGPCNIPRPGFWDAVGKAKWDAWDGLGSMSTEEAMTAYVDEMKLILEGMPITEEVENLLKVLGPFYEMVDEKKKITQVSDLTTGFGRMLSSAPSKSVTRSIIRTMELNGTLPSGPAAPKASAKELWENDEEEKERDEEEEDDKEDGEDEVEEEDEILLKEVKKDKELVAYQPKKDPSRKPKVPFSNGKGANGVAHLTNGNHSTRSALNTADQEEGPPLPEAELNGHHTGDQRRRWLALRCVVLPADPCGDVSGHHHLASDSDSEVYCDSVDQFGQEAGSEEPLSSLDMEEEQNLSPVPSQEAPETTQGSPEGPPETTQGADEGPPETTQGADEEPPGPLQRGGEDGDHRGGSSQRRRQHSDRPDSSVVRRGRGSKSSGLSPRGEGGPMQGSGGGDRERWGGMGSAASLDEQIVLALGRLQDDMHSVLERLHTLEALTASQSLQARSLSRSPSHSPSPLSRGSRKPSWWPFDVSPSTVAFAVIWPFVLQLLIRLYLQRRRR